MYWDFTKVIRKANNVIPENLGAVHLLWETQRYKFMEQPIAVEHCDWLLNKFLQVKISQRGTFIWTIVFYDKFIAAINVKKWSFGFFWPNLPQLGLFHPYFVCKSSFRVISMTKMVIWDQSKPISLLLKIK